MKNKDNLKKAVELRHEIHRNPDISEAERGSGDFGHYAKHTKVTTYFVCMGKGKPDTHTTGFDFDDDSIGLNVDIYRNLISDF